MPQPLSFGKIDFNLTAGAASGPATPDPETPFRILILGDFSGRANRAGSPPPGKLGNRSPLVVDRDNLDQVLAKAGVELHLPVVGRDHTPLVLRFAELDDFHPDRIFQRLELFQALRELRRKLNNPATFAAAAAEMRGWGASSETAQPDPESSPPAPVDPANLLEQMLGGPLEPPGPPPAQPFPGAGDWSAYLQKIIEPYTLPKTDYSKQAQLLALVDDATGRQMRALLHHPDFQATEAAWRAVHFLTRRLDTDAHLKLSLLDVSKAELAADLGWAEDLRATGTYRLLVEQTVGTPGGQPWALLVGLYTFGPGRADVELLGRLAKVARAAGAPFLAAAEGRLLGCVSLAQTPDPDDWRQLPDPDAEEGWAALRRIPEADHLGLALPRFLLRLPYGKDTDPTEQFAFDELAEGSSHERYLWGNPAVACAYLLAEAFSRHGWDLRAGIPREVDGLPLHVYQEEGESQLQPCAEAWLTERAADAILSKGLMPLLSVRGRDAVRLGRLQSVAEPVKALVGRWC
jgi:type VI secretion system protein ImpC